MKLSVQAVKYSYLHVCKEKYHQPKVLYIRTAKVHQKILICHI